jgi:hypothetical protein
MHGSGLFLDYSGIVDHETVNRLLKSLKNSEVYLRLDKTTSKRLYSIVVECLENISRHYINHSYTEQKFLPFITASQQNNKIAIKTGNPLHNDQKVELVRKLDLVNQMDDADLTSLYDEVINNEIKPGDKGAGLGYILIKLKSGNKIDSVLL